MLSHVYIGITDYQRAHGFYAPLMATLGLVSKFADAGRGWAAWKLKDQDRPLFVIGRPFDGNPAIPGNGQMVALMAATRDAVDRCHALALANGATCEGRPGLRPQYHADYYGAYFRDPDGNKICVVCHTPSPN